MKTRILQYDQYIQQIAQEYQEKDLEAQQALQLKAKAEAAGERLAKDNEVLKRDLKGFQQRCEDLEKDLEIARGDKRQSA